MIPNGHRAIMGSRQEPDDSLDHFPTPPWATRALIERVLPELRIAPSSLHKRSVWEPACGEGHMAEVLTEYFGDMLASDIFAYGYERVHEKWEQIDFLNFDDCNRQIVDWIITNPPFRNRTEPFVLLALKRARVGVAMFVRLQWLESCGRYDAIFRDHPPTLVAFFAERVPLCKGQWKPQGATATAYIWLVWVKDMAPRAPFWIPPGQRIELTYGDDAERFTTHPVTRKKTLDHARSEDSVPFEKVT